MFRPSQIFSFTDWAKSRPREPAPGDRIDAQFQELIRAIKATQDALAQVRADDGKLKRGIVSDEQLLPRLRQQLLAELRAELEPLRQSVKGTFTSTIASEHQAELYAKDAEAAVNVATGLTTGMRAITAAAARSAEYVAKVAATTSTDATDAENWADYAEAQAANAIAANSQALQWAEYLAGPVVDATNAPAYIAGTFPHGLYYQPVQGGLAGLWSAKWWALYAQQLVGTGAFYYLGAATAPPTPGGTNPITGQKYPNPIAPGSLYYNTATNQLYVWNGTGWQIQQLLTAAYSATYIYHATANQTAFSGADINGQTPTVGISPSIVHSAGLRLQPTIDYTINANTLTLATPATAGTVIQWDLLVPQANLAPGTVNIYKLIPLTPNGTTTDFPIQYYAPGTGTTTNAVVNSPAELMVVLDGVIQDPGIDFTTSNNGTTSTLHMTAPPGADSHFWAQWFQPAATGGTTATAQYHSHIVPIANKVALTSSVATNVASVVLPPGEWLIWGEIWFDSSTGNTTINHLAAAITTTPATLPPDSADDESFAAIEAGSGPALANGDVLPLTILHVNVAADTTYYLVARAQYTGSGQLYAYGKIAGVVAP